MDGTWPTNQRIQYNTMMLYHNIINSDYKRVAGKVFAEQTKENPQQHRDLKSITDSTRIRSEIKKSGEHEQIKKNR